MELSQKANLKRRILMSVIGVIINGICVAFFKIAAFGVDPFQSFMAGLDLSIPLSFGLLYTIVNASLLIFSLVFDRHYIGLATFINMFLLGYVTEFTMYLLRLTPLFAEPAFVVRVFCLVFGLIFICLGASLYMTADLGVSTYDAVALIIVNTWKKGKFFFVRVITDLVCVLLGCGLFLLGGGLIKDIPTIVGIGTLITAFCMGPVIEIFNKLVSKPLLKK